MIIFNQLSYCYTKLFKNKLCYYLCFVVIGLLSINLFVSENNKISIVSSLINLYPSPTVNDFICPIRGDKWIVVTTIFYPTPAIYKFLSLTTKWNLIVVA